MILEETLELQCPEELGWQPIPDSLLVGEEQAEKKNESNLRELQ